MCWQFSSSVVFASFGRSFRDSTTEVVQQGVARRLRVEVSGLWFGTALQQQHQHTQHQQPCARAVESLFTVITVSHESP